MVSNRSLFPALIGLCLLVLVAGCASEQGSLHEHDHEEPDHWPSGIAEAAEYIDQRLERLGSAELEEKERIQCTEELFDLVEWSPEIAADTDLSESDWIPIYEASEAIRKRMNSEQASPTEFADDFKQLTLVLRNAGKLLPEPEAGEVQTN